MSNLTVYIVDERIIITIDKTVFKERLSLHMRDFRLYRDAKINIFNVLVFSILLKVNFQ